jgi:cytochrome c-type biogenesis protein
MMSGYSVAALDAGEVPRERLLRVVLLFIAGFTVVFAAFGATASSVGRYLAANLPLATRLAGGVVIIFGLLIVAMSLQTGGALGWLEREARFTVRPSGLGALAAPAMGAAFAFGWTPCIGPILTVVLATAATRETLAQGVILLVAYSIGLGLPFLFAALGLHRAFRRLRPHLRTINVIAGIGLTAFGVVMVTGNLSRIAGVVTQVFVGIPLLEKLAQI